MKKLLLFGAPILLFSCGENSITDTSTSETIPRPDIPVPTVVYENMGDEEAYEERREAYFDLIHSNSDNVDWRAINEANFREKAERRAELAQYMVVETFAEGRLEGEWNERGSKDVPGNIRICDFHSATDDIYAISDGGILWKGNLDGATWTPLNDDLQLGRRVIKVVELEGGEVRIIAAVGSRLRYSDDNGESWTDAEGLGGSNGTGINLVELNDDDQTLVYLYNQFSQNKIAYSTDKGANFTFVTDLASSNSRYASMDVAFESSTAYILDNNDDVYKFEAGVLTSLATGLDMDGTNRCMIQANEAGGELTLYTLMDRKNLYKSTDGGESFAFISETPTNAWDVGFQVAIDNPDILYYGEVNLLRSYDGGGSWDLVSEWWEYYDDVENKIHADIMSIEPFKTSSGEEFTLIPNHGGLYVSYDNLLTTTNISLQDLNTGQFYDVLTNPDNAALIYGGTQDQGFQRTLTGDTPTPSSFEQVISGDYGEMQFTHNGETIWIQYPGADFQIYPNAETDGWYTHAYNVDGLDMPNVNWIVPTGAAPHPEDDFIYVGGGNLSGGSGSRLIKLTLDGGIDASQYEFDFHAESGASISAIETTPLEDEFIYIVTENGRFFHSENTGASFEMTPDYIGPSGGWIYTADIYASRITPGLVFVGGSGYGGASVYISRDSSKTFEPLDGDMPNTMVHEMAMDPDEKFLFAATDAGPYVYSMEEEEWFDMSGLSAPLQQYISVEYITSESIVRFATWGRGIWDFNISEEPDVDDTGIGELSNTPSFKLYPNPTRTGHLTVELEKDYHLFVFDLKGKVVFQQYENPGNAELDLSELDNGTYFLIGVDSKGLRKQEKIIIAR